jgi:hypothetical protein
MHRGADHHPDKPWKRRAVDEREGAQERSMEDRNLRAKRQHGMGAPGGAGRNWGRDDRGAHRGQDGGSGRRGEDFSGDDQLDPPRHGGGGVITEGLLPETLMFLSRIEAVR